MTPIPLLNISQLIDNIKKNVNPFFGEYYAFYSSWFRGITTEPSLMLLPMDDHMVHRGDGVFETMHAFQQTVYLLEAHLQRLLQSAEKLSLQLPCSLREIKHIIAEVLKVADREEAMVRVFLSRGPGHFSVNPYDAIQTQLYVVTTAVHAPPPEKYTQGALIGKSSIPVKPSWLAQIKSCNYLPNVLMKKEAIDRKLDMVISVDDNGYLAEGATENIIMVNQDNVIVYPEAHFILQGTTMVRVCELAHANGLTTRSQSLSVNDLITAKEVMLTGTSLNVLPVVKFEEHLIGNGKPGEIAKQLNDYLLADIRRLLS